MEIGFFSTKNYDRESFDAANQRFGHSLTYMEPSLSPETKALAKGMEGVCVFVNDKLDGETISFLAEHGLKLIALRCAGFNNVDMEMAAEKGIKVLRVPAYSPYAVAEHAAALILTLNRKTHKAFNRVREQNFSLERLQGFDLFGKKVGVVGTGKIGKAFCNIMLGFGCEIMAFDIHQDEELLAKGVTYVSVDELCRKSDIVSLHCPLNQHTHHLINKERISLMKEGVMLINTSRGGLIDTKAAIGGLKHGKLGYLGIDVYEQEEGLFFYDHSETLIQDETLRRLMTFPNVLITAHQAFFTRNALSQIAETTLQNASDFEKGNINPQNEVKLAK